MQSFENSEPRGATTRTRMARPLLSEKRSMRNPSSDARQFTTPNSQRVCSGVNFMRVQPAHRLCNLRSRKQTWSFTATGILRCTNPAVPARVSPPRPHALRRGQCELGRTSFPLGDDRLCAWCSGDLAENRREPPRPLAHKSCLNSIAMHPGAALKFYFIEFQQHPCQHFSGSNHRYIDLASS